ncbi:MAG: phage tail protein [Chromatiales bacterium]|nr:phage tail protein [Chromatiales bacterium]
MATIQQQLDEAKAAYHALKTGRSARVVVDQNGERVEFTAANQVGLYNWIKSLEQQLSGSIGVVPQNIGPARFIF